MAGATNLPRAGDPSVNTYRLRLWPALLLIVVVGVVAATTISQLSGFAQDHYTTQRALGNLREATLQQNALRRDLVLVRGPSDGLPEGLAAARATTATDLAALVPLLDPADFAPLSRLATAYQAAGDDEIAHQVAGQPLASRDALRSTADRAFTAFDAGVEELERAAWSAAGEAARLQAVGSVAVFTAALLAVLVFFVLYRRRTIVVQRAADVAAARTVAVRALGRIAPLATPEATAAQITDTLLELPDVDVAVIFGFVDGSGVEVLAVTGPEEYPLKQGDRLPDARSLYLWEHATAGPWAEPWIPDRADGEYGTGLTRAGLRAVAFGPIGRPGNPVGLLVIGATRHAAAGLADNLPTVVEFAGTASHLLGSELASRRDRAKGRTEIESIVARAAFTPMFQPVVLLSTNRPIGFEALTRFDDGRPPDLVFAQATRVGASRDLEAATLRAAVCASDALPAGPWLSLNVSADFLIGDRRLPEILAARTRPIVIEVTEHDVISDYAALRAALVALGPDVRVAVDDAGAGIANFGHILELRPDFLKVDVSIVRGIDRDVTRQALMAGLHHFARATSAWLIAEGVETESERSALAALDVTLGQGYLFARPASASTFEAQPVAAGEGPTMRPYMRLVGGGPPAPVTVAALVAAIPVAS
jgi:EAL domain-containing protein (putative c-di-GMP-specific phosphodiesterase class I)